MKFIAIIPARYDSTRFRGKPLAKIKGKTMIRRVYEQCKKALEEVYVATDNSRIEEEVKSFKGRVIMTGKHHQSGTDRLAEAISIVEKTENKTYDIVINVQGDEPYIQPEQIQELMNCFSEYSTEIATLIKKITTNDEIFNPSLPKVVTNHQGYALYFSRSPVPYLRNKNKDEWIQHYPYKKHLGMYGYRKDVLQKITKLKPSPLELAESLEQNRWLENGFLIKTELTEFENYPVDTPEDLDRFQ